MTDFWTFMCSWSTTSSPGSRANTILNWLRGTPYSFAMALDGDSFCSTVRDYMTIILRIAYRCHKLGAGDPFLPPRFLLPHVRRGLSRFILR